MWSNTDSTILSYFNLNSDTITGYKYKKECPKLRFTSGYLLDLNDNTYLFACQIVLVEQNHYACRKYDYITSIDNNNS